jgi:hypothetical protein
LADDFWSSDHGSRVKNRTKAPWREVLLWLTAAEGFRCAAFF